MDYKIRKLQKNDLKGVSFFETLSSLRPVEDLSFSLSESIFSDCQKRGIEIYVAESEGLIVGTIRLMFEPKFYHHGKLVAHIEDVSTHEKYQGKGVARSLIDYAISLCKEKKCYKIILDCDSQLVEFYKKFGFQLDSNCMRINL